ncbi:MAG: diacylglycerol kinase family protein [Hyphomicrobiales bacterium]
MIAGVIINPSSGRNRGKGLALAEALKPHTAVAVKVLGRFSDLVPSLQALAKSGVDVLYISSGDGTVQAIQTLLAEERIFAALPRLCLIPHGTTNMNAASVGLQIKNVAAQADFIVRNVVSRSVEFPTLRLANPSDGKPRHGMFLGTGALAQAVKLTQTSLNDKGVHGDLAGAVMMGSALWKYLTRAPDPTDLSRIDRPHDMTVAADGAAFCEGPQLLLLVTVLDRLMMGARPFWGSKNAPLRLTRVAYPPPNPLRWTLPLLYGGEARRAPPGADSRAAKCIRISGPTDYALDGEFVNVRAGEALEIETGPSFTYVQG